MSDVYAFRPGHFVPKVAAQVIGESLDQIRLTKGKLTPENLVEDASGPEHPLHEAFEWDDSLAAHQHRLQQARRLIVSIRVLNAPVQTPVPVYVSVRDPKEGRVYQRVLDALTDEQVRERILDDIRQSLESIQRRYAHFSEAARILDRLLEHVH